MMNTVKETIIIPTVGLGSRMGEISNHLNKALLPYKNKPILSHIIDAFPDDTSIIIPIGYLAQQIKDYCGLVYPNRDITFVSVSDWTSEKSGTAHTLLHCTGYVSGPFWYIPCDTYFSDDTLLQQDRNENCFYIEDKPSSTPELYTMFEIADNRISGLKFKEVAPSTYRAFTGLMYIHEYAEFFETLSASGKNEFIYVIQSGSRTELLPSWKDFGNYENYINENKTTDYDFSKPEEITYVGTKSIIKWWKDPITAKQKYEKTQAKPNLYPSDVSYAGQFLYYTKIAGTTLYDDPNISMKFTKLLAWLDTDVWEQVPVDISSSALTFYKAKSLSRIDLFLKNHKNLVPPRVVDGVDVKDYSYYLDKIDWQYLADTAVPTHIHGDLQFDNIISSTDDEFFLIDWRHNFADQTALGDLYYDLSKLLGGLIIQYSEIKANNFDVAVSNNGLDVTLAVPTHPQIKQFVSELHDFVLARNLDFEKVQMIVPIIFWNMAPLHNPPFDTFLWYLGLKLFAELDGGKNEIYKPE